MQTIALLLALGALLFFVIRSRPDIGQTEARALVEGGATLVDVRSPAEFASGHVDGAVNIPVDSIAERVDEIDRDQPVVLYCRSGARSGRAARVLKDAGFERVHNIGAMPSW